MARPLVLILLSFLLVAALPHSGPVLAAGDSPIVLSVFSEDSSSPNLVEPTFTIGSSFNVTVTASNLPPVVDQNSGGVSGFDISLGYNASIIRVERAGFNAPFCPLSDGCIFDLPTNDTLSTVSAIDTPPGTLREAMVSLGPSHRALTPPIIGQPAFLFRVTFDVVGKGLAPIRIQQSSQLLGFSAGCGSLLPFSTTDGSFDNREPFRVTATPLTPTVAPGASVTLHVNVSLVNSAGNGNIVLALSGIVPAPTPQFFYQFTPMSGTLNGLGGMNSFLSTLQITAASATVTPPGNYPLTIAGALPSPAPNAFQYNYNFTLIVGTGSSAYAVSLPTTSQVAKVVTMAPTYPAPGLLAAFTISSSPAIASPVTFHAVAVWCFSAPYALHWNFGDGASGTGNPAFHTFSSSGTYTVTLNATDSSGNSYLSSQVITIPASSPQPVPPSPGVSLALISSLILLALLFSTAAVLFVRRRRKG